MKPGSEVEILLATFNGERFLRQQIDSLLNQDYQNIRVLARDDGSSDGTMAVLREYAELFPEKFRLLVTEASTSHPKWNFLELLKTSTADYICLSDQDDVWLPFKVRSEKQAMDQLERRYGPQVPLLVFSDLRIVDESLKELDSSFWKRNRIRPESIHRLQVLLGQNVLTGCTAMLNRKLVELSLRMPEEAQMHDRWIALLAASMGKSLALPQQTVLYRQHQNNVIGSRREDDSIARIVRQARNSENRLKEWRVSQRQAEALLRLHGEQLDPKRQALLQQYRLCGQSKSRFVRLFKIIRYGFFRGGLLQTVATVWDLWNLKKADN